MSDTHRQYLEHVRETRLDPVGPFQLRRKSRSYADGPGIYQELEYIVTAPNGQERVFPDWEAARGWAKSATGKE